MPSRADQGIGLYDPATNNVNICGFGSVPTGCGVTMSKREFGPRAGIAWRVSKSFVVRAGYGITNDPYSLDRPFKYNYPTLLIATYDAPNSYSWATTLQQGIPQVQLPDFGNGFIPLPAAYTTATLNLHEYKRGYIQSWNLTMQKEIGFGLTAQAGYIATRSTDMQIGVNINAGQFPGAGTNGQPLKSLYGRYLYGDFCSGQLRSFPAVPGKRATDDRPLGPEVPSLTSFGEDDAGRIYATSLDGAVYRLDPAG
jgi:hypothetical protein